ncbi:expressed unknown protein [Seminavis robusta]|uniref:Uncharacterized protein n=1 Tax=Seminavis robusta TaxID=568900 RepID=A0A9N8HMX2_9STRA|nr:expressed unknown protein [Seminavis robusta]|eukprot:Sro778_g201180.1 n/a (166) ;mRNA; r:31141-31638
MISRKRCRVRFDPSRTTATGAELTQQQKPKKVVRFTLEPAHVTVWNSSSSETWYSGHDYTNFKLNMKRDVLYLAHLCQTGNRQNMDHEEFSSLGLEQYCCSNATKQQTKMMANRRIQSVLDQQNLQRRLGCNEPETIQFFAQLMSQLAVEKALRRAARVAAGKYP